MADYDIGAAFAEIEDELISSMVRNLKRHQLEEAAEGFEWEQWQALQLQALEDYKRKAAQKYGAQFSTINSRIEESLAGAYNTAETAQERQILERLKRGLSEPTAPFSGSTQIRGEFFKTNDRKLDALIDATTNDMKKAEYAVLRTADDRYRKIIFNAQVYANTGAGTYAKAVDMAARDFLSAGINCIRYKDGRQVNIRSYAEMALRTASKRAYLQGEGEMRKKWGIHTVILNKRTNACPKCAPFAGKVIVDDVWSGGTAQEAAEKGYLLMSECIKQGLYHPNCQDSHTTYFGDFLREDEAEETEEQALEHRTEDEELLQEYTPEEQEKNIELYNAEQRANYCERQTERFERLEKYSLDKDNRKVYGARRAEWEEQLTEAETAAENLRKRVAIGAESGIINTAALTEDEQAALNAYISSESYKVNEKLRSEITLTEEEKWIVNNLDSALGKLPKYKGTVYRSLDSSMMENLSMFWILHQPGSIVGYKAFTSTSLKIYDDRMDIQFVIISKNGRDITFLNPNEEEILFERNSEFIITEIRSNIIYMEEV